MPLNGVQDFQEFNNKGCPLVHQTLWVEKKYKQNNEVLLPFKQHRGVLKETCESLAKFFFLIVYEFKFCFITLDSL